MERITWTTCGSVVTDCADLSWDFVEVQLIWIVWALIFLIVVSLNFSLTAKLSSFDVWKIKLATKLQTLEASPKYLVTNSFLTVLQCILYCIRSYTKTMPAAFLVLEVLACVTAMFDVLGNIILQSMHGVKAGMLMCITQGLVEVIIFASVLGSTVEIKKTINSPFRKTWFSFSFFGFFRLLQMWRCFVARGTVNLENIKWQSCHVIVRILSMIFFAATMMQTLENLGDTPGLELWNPEPPEWSLVSSFYYIFVTISTVGYGDITPRSVFGRFFAVVTILGGIIAFSLATHEVHQVISFNRAGMGGYKTKHRFHHIVVTGSPSFQMVKDFLSELYHPDHADDADDLEVVIALASLSGTFNLTKQWLRRKENQNMFNRVTILVGSVVDDADLPRFACERASAIFILPDIFTHDPHQDDTENIVRALALRRCVPHVRMIVLFHKSENKAVLKNNQRYQRAGISGNQGTLDILGIDQFKLELLGKSCDVIGFSTLICNLCKTIGDSEDDEYTPKWSREYQCGLGNELYEIPLSPHYFLKDSSFGEVVLDCLERSDSSQVYLIGLVEHREDNLGEKRILINPGPKYKIKSPAQYNTYGIFVSPDRDSIRQMEEGDVMRGRRSGNEEEAYASQENDVTAEESNNTQTESKVQGTQGPEWSGGDEMDPEQIAREELRILNLRYEEGLSPPPPPPEVLLEGGHILFCITGEKSTMSLGLAHFVRPLRNQFNNKHVPIIFLGKFIPPDWHTIAPTKGIYFLHGSSLSTLDLQRAAYKTASVVVIFQTGGGTAGNDPYLVDAESIFSCKLIEADHISSQIVIAELTFELNFHFISLPHDNLAFPNAQELSYTQKAAKKDRVSRSGQSAGILGAISLLNQGTDSGSKRANQENEDHSSNFQYHSEFDDMEYFRQSRFACGRLFLGNVVTSLAVNTFFNPSLAVLINYMIESNVESVEVPKEWEGRPYSDFFEYLLFEENLLAVCIFRTPAKDELGSSGGLNGFVFTAPPAMDTAMCKKDKVMAFTSPIK